MKELEREYATQNITHSISHVFIGSASTYRLKIKDQNLADTDFPVCPGIGVLLNLCKAWEQINLF